MNKQCPKCAKPMVRGFLPDSTYGSYQMVGLWYEGTPVPSLWTGTKVPPTGGQPIGAFRCGGCGFLEFYAGPEYAAAKK